MMDSEDYYEARRLDDEAAADRFESLKESNKAVLIKEIRREFEDGFAGKDGARLPQSYINFSGKACVGFTLPIANAIADVCDHEIVMATLLSAVDPNCCSPSTYLSMFRDACVDAYIKEYADDLAEIVTHDYIE